MIVVGRVGGQPACPNLHPPNTLNRPRRPLSQNPAPRDTHHKPDHHDQDVVNVRNTSFFGSDDSLVHVTRDGGGSWKNVTPPDMPDFARVSLIDASAFDAGSSPWSSPREHRDRRGAVLARRDEGAVAALLARGATQSGASGRQDVY